MENSNNTVGVVVGRFQVDTLSTAHIRIIEEVRSRHHKMIIFLGVSPGIHTKRNPLDYRTRELMILSSFPEITVLPIMDTKDNDTWSAALDRKIREIYPTENAILYGGRDSFLPSYTGKFQSEELTISSPVSGTEIRAAIAAAPRSNASFRAGAIYASQNRFGRIHPVVDVVPIQQGSNRILVGKKPSDKKWRFIGGFVDPSDADYEHAASRELAEETDGSVQVSPKDLMYLGSYKIQDWRYKDPTEVIVSNFYLAPMAKTFNEEADDVRPGDDIGQVHWLSIFDFWNVEAFAALFEEVHQPLATALYSRLASHLVRAEVKE